MQYLLKSGAVALFVLSVILPAATATAEEQYLIVPLASLKQVEPEQSWSSRSWGPSGMVFAAHLDSPGSQAFLSRAISWKFQRNTPGPPFVSSVNVNNIPTDRFSDDLTKIDDQAMYLVMRIDGGLPTQMQASVFDVNNWPITDSTGYQFEIDWNKHYSKEQESFAKAAFLLCKRDYYSISSHNYPGAVYFAYLARETQKKINTEFGLTQPADDQPATPFSGGMGTGMSTRQNQSLVRSFDLLSGSRAIEQNLELDATLNAWKQEQRTVDVADITGITVAEIDWEPLVRDLPDTKLDRFAACVPADQHIIVFPDFRTAHKFAKLTEQSGIPVLQFLNYRDTSSDKRTFQRYQRQLGLSLDALSELLGPMLIDSVAVTGGDLYFPTGTDITILFETKNADALLKLLIAKAELQFSGEKNVEHLDGANFVGYSNDGRIVSSYLSKIDENTVAVSNSHTSIQRIIETKGKEKESLADLAEYRFFRDRYKVGDASESVFAFLSDATIRRWCGPQWRIAASRRLWQQAVIGQMQAEHAADIINGNMEETRHLFGETIISETRTPGFNFTQNSQPLGERDTSDTASRRQVGVAGITIFALGRQIRSFQEIEAQYNLTPNGVQNSMYGTYQFLTPIVELNIDKVTEAERRAYDQWRNEYEGRWRRNFDPIGIRITLDDTMMASDVTVMPINVRTNREFAQWLGFSTGASFSPDQSVYGVPLQFIISINPESQMFRSNANLVEQLAGGVSLGWIGSHATVFYDDDPFWGDWLEETQKNNGSSSNDFLLENINRLPVGVEVASNNPLRLAAFLTGLRGMVEQSAPGLTQWEALNYRDVPYVKVAPRDDNNMMGIPDNFAIYYTPANGRLFVTLSESMLKRHIDRRLDAQPESQTSQWSGENMALRLDERAIPVLDRLYMMQLPEKMTDSAWRNVPILDEYKRRFPDKDPATVHEQLWGERLFCPNDGTYEWNETWHTFVPQLGELPTASPIAAVKEADLGVTFENDGIRARVQLDLK